MSVSGCSGQECSNPCNSLCVCSVGIEIDEFQYQFPQGGKWGCGLPIELLRALEFELGDVVRRAAAVLDLTGGPY